MSFPTPSNTAERHALAGPRVSRDGAWNVPAITARPGGPAERVAARLSDHTAATIFMLVILSGLATLAALSIGLGFLVTRVLVHAWGLGAADERVNVWLAAHRDSTLGDASLVGSIIAGGVVLPIIAGLLALAFVAVRHWRLAAFTLFALGVESGSYRLTTLAVHRHRPSVPRLESLPANASYPSGHTAAAIAVYGGLVVLLTSKLENGALRAVAWTIAVAVPTYVAWARMYRGMHHPLDVAGGVVIGVLALVVVVFASRAADAAASR